MTLTLSALLGYLLKIVTTVVVPTVGAYAVKFVRQHVKAQTLNLMVADAHLLVRSAETLAASGVLPKGDKFTHVLTQMQQIYRNADVKLLVSYIEAAVHQLNTTGGEFKTPATPVQRISTFV